VNELALHPSGNAFGTADPFFGLSLCAGAGGIDLGLTIACPGYRTVCYVEREAYAAAVLVARMEDAALDTAPVWDDVGSFDGSPWRGKVDKVFPVNVELFGPPNAHVNKGCICGPNDTPMYCKLETLR